jgi:nitric oxide reductase NorD protein
MQCIDDIAQQYKREIARMKFLLDAMQPQGTRRIRKLEDGDEIDINAAIRSMIDIRMGMQPDPRIMMRSVRKVRDISVLVLLDLSESTNEKVAGHDYSVLDLTRQATVLLANAINKIGDPFAIHGFCSDGRHDVEYYRYKDFDQPYNEIPKARLAGMTGQLSTRMGAAMRHATHYLKLQKSAKKLLLVITDGEPADVDVRDPTIFAPRHQKSRGRSRPLRHPHLLHEPRSSCRSVRVAHLRRTQLSGGGSCGAVAGEIAGVVCGD